MDLYEVEYNEDDFKKPIKNHHHHHQVVPNHHHHHHKTNKKIVKNIIPPDEESMVVERSIGLSFDSFFSSQEDDDSEESTYNSFDESARSRVVPARTRKRTSKEVSNSSQRNDIDKRMRTLQNLLPNSHKDDNEALLDETINYMTNLQHQVQMMTMNNRFVTPSMIIPPPLLPHYSQMGMQMGLVPQFFNHPGLIQNSSLFASMENNYSPQPTQSIKKR